MADDATVKFKLQLTNAKQLSEQISNLIQNKILLNKNPKNLNKAKTQIQTSEQFFNEGHLEQSLRNLSKAFGTLTTVLSNAVPGANAFSAEIQKLNGKIAKAAQDAEKAERQTRDFTDKNSISGLEGNRIISLRKKGVTTDVIDNVNKALTSAGLKNVNWSNKNSVSGMAGSIRDAYSEKYLDGNEKATVSQQNSFLEALRQLYYTLDKETQKLLPIYSESNNKGAFNAKYSELKSSKQAAISAETQKDQLSAQLQDQLAKQNDVVLSTKDSKFNVSNAIVNATMNQEDIDKLTKEVVADKQKKSESSGMVEGQNDTTNIDKMTSSLDKQKTTVGKAVSTFFGYQMILRQLRKVWNRAVTTVTELDKQLTSQAIVTNLTRSETWGLVSSYQALAKQTGFTTTEIASVTTEYLKQGESVSDALTLTEAAAKAAQVAGISATSSVQYLTTAIHGFQLEASDALSVSDKFAALAADSATDYNELAEALSKVASQAELADMSMNYTLALLTTSLDVTQESGESIGTALKTVIARMREISDYGETLEDGSTVNDVEESLNVIGVKLRDQNGELRSTEDVLDEVGKKWDTLSSNQQAAVAKALAGTRQQSRLVAILNNYDEVLKYQIEAANSVGATNAQMQEYLQGMEAAENNMTVAFEEMVSAFTDNDFFIWLVNEASDLLSGFTKFFKSTSGQVSLWTGLGALLINAGGLTKVQSIMTTLISGTKQLVTGTKEIENSTNNIANNAQKTANNVQSDLNPLENAKSNYKSNTSNFFRTLITPGSNYKGKVSYAWKNLQDSKTNYNNIKNKTDSLDGTSENLEATYKKINSYSADDLKKAEAEANETDYIKENYSAVKNYSVDTASYADTTKLRQQIINDSNLTSEQQILLLRQTGLTTEQAAAAVEQQKLLSISQGIGKSLQLISAISMVINMIQKTATSYDDAMTDIMSKKTSATNELESKIYDAASQRSTLNDLIDNFKDLDSQVVKSTTYLEDINDLRSDLIDELDLDETTASKMSTSSLIDQAQAKTTELDSSISDSVDELAETLTTASGGVSFSEGISTYLQDVATGAGAGALAGSFATGAGTAVGAIAGGAVGSAIGIAEIIQKNRAAKNAKAQIQALLETDDGVDEFHTVMEYYYKDTIDTTTEAGQNLADAVESSYTSLIEGLDSDELASLLEEYDDNISELTAALQSALTAQGAAVVTINDEDSNLTDKITALKEVYASLASESETLAESFKESYVSYFSLDETLGDSVKYADEFGWTLSYLSDATTALGDNSKSVLTAVGEALSQDTTEEKISALNTALAGLGTTITSTITDMITSGQDFLDLGDDMTSAASKVSDIIDTQSGYSDLTYTERAEWLNEHLSLFTTDGEWDQSKYDTFLNGGDMTAITASAKSDLQDDLRDEVETLIVSKTAELSALQSEYSTTTDADTAEDLLEKITDAQGSLAILETQLTDIDTLFDLTISDVVDKQSSQIDALKEMYEQEEQDLEDSLNNRKDAYQKYFDAINDDYDEEDYEKSRDELMTSIGSLSAGTDATSINKVNDLRKQLQDLEDEREKTRRQDAQDALLEDIDDQLDEIEDYYDKFLDNDSEILASLNSSSYSDYEQYMISQGKTAAEIAQWESENSDLLSGVWSRTGISSFDNVSGIFSTLTQQGISDALSVLTDSTADTLTLDHTNSDGTSTYNFNGTNITLTNSEYDVLNALMKAIQSRTGY